MRTPTAWFGIRGAFEPAIRENLTNLGMIGMTAALLIAGYQQSFIERAAGSSTWSAYFAAQLDPWFMRAMVWRNAFGIVFALGVVLLVWDFPTIGRGERRPASATAHSA